MSEPEDASVLGKRGRDGDAAMSEGEDVGPPAPPPPGADEDSDDEVGPMPIPDTGATGARKKKRKGASSTMIVRQLPHKQFRSSTP